MSRKKEVATVCVFLIQGIKKKKRLFLLKVFFFFFSNLLLCFEWGLQAPKPLYFSNALPRTQVPPA